MDNYTTLWVRGIFQHYKEKEKPSWGIFFEESQEVLEPQCKEFQLPPITASQLADTAKWRGGTHTHTHTHTDSTGGAIKS